MLTSSHYSIKKTPMRPKLRKRTSQKYVTYSSICITNKTCIYTSNLNALKKPHNDRKVLCWYSLAIICTV